MDWFAFRSGPVIRKMASVCLALSLAAPVTLTYAQSLSTACVRCFNPSVHEAHSNTVREILHVKLARETLVFSLISGGQSCGEGLFSQHDGIRRCFGRVMVRERSLGALVYGAAD